MSISATALRLLGSLVGALLPKGKQLYAERSAGKSPDSYSVDFAEEILDEALGRLGAVDVEHQWWRRALVDLGATATQPIWFKKPHVQQWLSQTDVQRLLKAVAKSDLSGAGPHRDDYEALITSYMTNSFEDRQHAESIVTLAVAVLKASIKGAVRDTGIAAIVQTASADQRDLLMALDEKMKAIEPVDLKKLAELAKSYADLIPDDIGGTYLDRPSLFEALDSKLAVARVVQVRGLPGSGKSVLVKHIVKRALERGPALFLKAEQLEGTSWISYATSQGLSGTPLEKLLIEVGAVGTSILFIDAIDRVEKEQQPIILDIIRAIVESPCLSEWRVVVSLRDTGIEVLRNWLGGFLDTLKVETVSVEQLSDEEAETLAIAKPHLRPLLFGSAQVQDVVRRPFFAKVLNQSYVADPKTAKFAPQSEVDLIANWWLRGGYNETGQSAVERRRALLDLARIRSRQLSQPISLGQLNSVAHIDDLRSDGILQYAREGISVRFAHDIFFEWAFFHVLADRADQWMEEIKASGEPPAVARVVELASQWEYTQGKDWQAYLALIEASNVRSQWLRAWLVGPIGTAGFEVADNQFARTVFTDDFRLFRKTLVWFQAEKTTPNPAILSGALPQEQRQRYADLFSWPSDFSAWRRLIEFILRRVSDIPQRLYPEIVAIFEVWQNALADLRNPTSHAMLQQCARWLTAIDAIRTVKTPDENSEYWRKVPDLSAFKTSLGRLILRASRVEPTLAVNYVHQVTNSEHIPEKTFNDIVSLCPVLAQSIPNSVVELSLAFFCKELPDDQVAREDRELRASSEWRKTIRAKPESDRTHQEKMALSHAPLFRSLRDFSHHDWERLSLNDSLRGFWPPSPLREPFHSLFQSSPDYALHLLRELCNHAMAAWRQLHRHSRDRNGTPIPLELKFPWGVQQFWGTNREYLWFRSTWAPKMIGCGFLALEEWCFAELARGRPLDELIQQIVEGNECIAILGTAAMLVLHTEMVSEVTAPLFTSQRLFAADHIRMKQDISSSTVGLIGFNHRVDKIHIEAIQTATARGVRGKQLSWMVPRLVFVSDAFSDLIRNEILNFKNNLPYEYEEHRNIQEAQEHLTAQALEYAELVDPENYRAYRTKEDSNQVAIVHVSPSASRPENVARAEEASRFLKFSSLWQWAAKSFEEEIIQDTFAIKDAITLSKEEFTNDLFEYSNDKYEETQLAMYRGAVAAIAAIVLNFRDASTQEDLEWARDVLMRAKRLPENPGVMWSPSSVIPWHHAIYAARGLAADIREGTAAGDVAINLLDLIAHPLEVVSLAALKEACELWIKDPKLTWAALILSLSLCHVPPRPLAQLNQQGLADHSPVESKAAVEAVLAFYQNGSGWPTLPLPPPAWVKVKPRKGQRHYQIEEEYDDGEPTDAAEEWDEPRIFWHSKRAAEILNLIPFDRVLGSSASSTLLEFMAEILDWTVQKNSPPWAKAGHRDRPTTQIFEWTNTLGSTLGQVSGLIPLEDFQPRFLEPIFGVEDECCWAMLSPFASAYVCAYVYDALVVPADAVVTLDLCLGRLLRSSAFNLDAYRSGELSGFDQPNLVRTLMFVSVEHAGMAARYANGDWSEISLILPIIDRFIRAAGWTVSVMVAFLTLCERAKANYHAETFADQVLAIISEGPDRLIGWHGTTTPARIAELVQYFAHRDAPMTLAVAQKFLRILDLLVDMGDRRSAALQLSEAFRETRLSV
ncbi:hypothetical protein [Pseudomonas sp. NPDC087690]|jgi:hypothetical protein|uniref:hypothetical protein n=1 Tax=Pseudomonas sp. NPDC087690 TaxID=3364446 RepID=UPI003816258B